jgi:hypothetical protein
MTATVLIIPINDVLLIGFGLFIGWLGARALK